MPGSGFEVWFQDEKSEVIYSFCFFAYFFQVKYEELYCFSFNPKLDKEEREQGWKLVDLNEEYNRMGVPNNYWQISDVNRDYGVSCDFSVTEAVCTINQQPDWGPPQCLVAASLCSALYTHVVRCSSSTTSHKMAQRKWKKGCVFL